MELRGKCFKVPRDTILLFLGLFSCQSTLLDVQSVNGMGPVLNQFIKIDHTKFIFEITNLEDCWFIWVSPVDLLRAPFLKQLMASDSVFTTVLKTPSTEMPP
jgi:hypothetical protein